MSARLGLVVYALDRPAGGIATYSRELLAALHKEGIRVSTLQAGECNRGIPRASLLGASFLPGLLTLGQLEIGWRARRNRLSLVHDLSGTVPLAMACCLRVATLYDVIPYIYPQTSTRLDWLVYRCWLPVAVRGLQAVITTSRQSMLDIRRFLPVRAEDIMVIPGAAAPRYRPMRESEYLPALARAGLEKPYILYVGSIEPRKNLLRFLEAYALLKVMLHPRRLVIAGARNFWKTSPVCEAVKKLSLEGNVTFTGYVPEQDLPSIYNGADLFVFPSLYEGFGLPVLEAMACGVPVVTSYTSSLPEVGGESVLYVDPYDVQGLAEAMRRVLEDPGLACELRSKGLARAGQFSWERTARETIAVYERLLGEKLSSE